MDKIFIAVATSLITAAILAFFRRRLLYLVVPEIRYSTPISQGHLSSVTLVNRGWQSEEGIEIKFKPGVACEFLGASKSTVSCADRKISVPRLSAQESVTLILLADNGILDKNSLEFVESKSTKGKIVSKQEDALAVGANLFAAAIIIILLGGCFTFGTYFGKETGKSILDHILPATPGLNDDTTEQRNRITPKSVKSSDDIVSVSNQIKQALKSGELSIGDPEIFRSGDKITIETPITNKTDDVVEASASLSSSATDSGRVSGYKFFSDKILIMPGEKKSISVEVYLPENDPRKIVMSEITAHLMSDFVNKKSVFHIWRSKQPGSTTIMGGQPDIVDLKLGWTTKRKPFSRSENGDKEERYVVHYPPNYPDTSNRDFLRRYARRLLRNIHSSLAGRVETRAWSSSVTHDSAAYD